MDEALDQLSNKKPRRRTTASDASPKHTRLACLHAAATTKGATTTAMPPRASATTVGKGPRAKAVTRVLRLGAADLHLEQGMVGGVRVLGFTGGAQVKVRARLALVAHALDGLHATVVARNVGVDVGARRGARLDQRVGDRVLVLGFAGRAQVKVVADGAGVART